MEIYYNLHAFLLDKMICNLPDKSPRGICLLLFYLLYIELLISCVELNTLKACH